MMYQLYELKKFFDIPVNVMSKEVESLFSHPLSPFQFLPFSKDIASGAELVSRLTKQYTKPEFGIEHVTINGEDIPIQQDTIMERRFCSLVRFRKLWPAKQRKKRFQEPKLLIFAPLSGHYATLLRDTVRRCLQDYTVYITDWKNANTIPLSVGPFGFQDFVRYAIHFIEAFSERIHVMSVCQPTVPVLAALSIMAEEEHPHLPKTGIFMGGPIDARCNPTTVNELGMKNNLDWFKENMIYQVPLSYPGFMREVYPGFLQYGGFVLMNFSRHADAHFRFFEQLVAGDEDGAEHHRVFYDEYNSVLDLPAEFYLETVSEVFQKFSLPRGEMHLFDQRVRPEKIKHMRLMTVEGELDDISGHGQTAAAHQLCRAIPEKDKKHLELKGAGHYGIFSGRRWREKIYPQIHAFIQGHDL